jgi:hypothetical protein
MLTKDQFDATWPIIIFIVLGGLSILVVMTRALIKDRR